MFVRKNFLLGLSLVLLVVAVIFAVLSFELNKSGKSKSDIVKEYPSEIGGTVFLTLKEKGKASEVVVFDLSKKSFVTKFSNENCASLGGGVSLDGDKMAGSSNCGGDYADDYQLYWGNTKGETNPITKSDTGVKKEAVWSPDEKQVAFMSTYSEAPTESSKEEAEKVSFSDINRWGIFVSDLLGEEEFIANAVHPFFSPDSKSVLALKREGLFLFNIESGQGKKVHDFGVEVPISMQMDLSDDGKRLVISDPIKRDITIYDVTSWDDFEMTEKKKIETRDSYVSWPKLHPTNEKYLITEEIYENGEIHLDAYNLENDQKHQILDLSKYDHSRLWVNDWK